MRFVEYVIEFCFLFLSLQKSRKLVFTGTFTNGGLKIGVENGEVKIIQEGKKRKFVKQVEQVTFSGRFARESSQPVLYVTERAVFELNTDGRLELIEVAPGIDVERDILAHMEFEPIVSPKLQTMDPRIFQEAKMALQLRALQMHGRVVYDSTRNQLFINLSRLVVRSSDDIAEVRDVIYGACADIDGRVDAIVNYDHFRLDDVVMDEWTALVADLEANYYNTVVRYTTSAFMRAKLGKALEERQLAPHVFETRDEANNFLIR